MASFLCDLVKPYVEKLINGAIAEAHHVFCFTCIVKEFEEERAKLEPERRTIEQRVKVAKERDKDIQANVDSWEKDIDELNKVDTKTKQTCFFGFCPDCIWRYKKGKELGNKVKRIKELKGEKFENIELPRHVPGVERYSLKDYISFESREKKYKELSDALKDDNNYITGLHGMGGTGKTTLAIKVGKELKQSEQFAYVVDTAVSFNPDLKKIQDEIAGPLGLKWEDCNESDRYKKLLSRLTNGDKILVILDDVWDQGSPLDFDAIGIPKKDNCGGCRVLVTSRSEETFKNMGCGKIIALDLLSEKEACNMFERYAGICNTTPKKLIDKGRQIAKECKQLPIAISVIARSLKGQEKREYKWDVALKSLKQHVYKDCVDNNMAVIHNCLKISYDHLMDEKLKGLFLLCSVFREDEEISIEVLTRLCIGVSFFGEDCEYYNDARNEVVDAKDKLVDSCLLLEVDAKRVKMHDMVREAAQGIANKKIQCVKLFDKKQKSLVEKQTNIKHLLCEGKYMDFFNLKFDGSKLETLIVKAGIDEDCKCIEVPNSFFENVIKLRVLYFSGNYQQPTLSLLDLIQSLTNIRSMSFDNVDLGDISILGNLQNLETLELVRCKINELPNQITELKKFKLLKLKYCTIRKNNPFEVIKRCASLEELYFKDSFNDSCKEITLSELQRYHINFNGYLEGISRFPKYVVFCGDEDEACQFSEETLKYCMQTANALCLEGIEGEWRNLMPEIVSVELGMNDLVELHLVEISQLQCLIDTNGSQVPDVLSNLVVLELEIMENLEELFNGPLSFESLNNLEKLSIKECKHLQSLFKGKLLCNLKSITIQSCPLLVFLFEVSTSQSLVLLEKLKIADCEGLETIIADERIEDEEIDDGGNNKSYGSVFSKLKVIDIKECRRLESILHFLSAQDLPALETIRIIKCDELKYVFGQSQQVELVSLIRLKLSELPNFIGIFKEGYHHMSSCGNGSSSTSKAQIQLDPIKCNIFSCYQTRIPLVDDVDGDHNTGGNNWVNVFPKLKELDAEDCEQLEYIFGHDTSDHQLHFPELTDLRLVGLPSLIATCPKQYRIAFPSLKSLELGKCSQDNTIIKELSGNVNPFLTLEILKLYNNSNVENIFSLSEVYGQLPLDFGLQEIELFDLPMMTCLFLGPKNSFALKNLTRITIKRCGKLKFVFSTSILRFLPELLDLRIEECEELENIIEDDLENKNNSNSLSSRTCFPKLETLGVINCNKLKFVFSTSILRFLPQLCNLRIEECEELEHIIEDDSENKDNSNSLSSTTCFPNLEILAVIKCNKLKFVFSTSILRFLPELRYLRIEECEELENIIEDDLENKNNSNSLSSRTCFPKLETLGVINCNKLKFVFSTSILRFLPELFNLRIEDCKELEHIIEDDLENKINSNSLSSTTCFPKLEDLAVIKCNKLKFVFPFSVCKELPKLKALLITEANELEEIFKSEDDQKVDIPNLKIVAFDMLPSLCCAQGNQFQAVKNRFVQNCQKLTLNSAKTTNIFEDFGKIGYILHRNVKQLFEQLQSAETTEDFEKPSVENVQDLTILPTNSKELLNQQSMDKQYSLEETDTIVKPSQLDGSTSEKTEIATISGTKNEPPIQVVHPKQKIQMKQTPEAEHEFVEHFPNLAILPTNSELEGSTSENTAVAIVSTISGTKNEPPIQVVAPKQKGIEIEGTSKTNNDQVSLNDEAFMKVNSTVEEQFSKDDKITVSKSKPSPNITSQFPSTPSKGDPSQKVEDLSSSLLVKRELEELIFKKHLKYENLSLLTDFLVENPSVRLKDTSLSNRYKGCAYKSLAQLLKFLKTHSLLEVSGSSHSEFVELLQDARSFAFDKEWLDGAERRTLFPEIQVSPDDLEKLLDSKKQITKNVEDLKHQLTSSEAVLESIVQQEAVLRAPIGY